ncbi:MAG TPA: carboxypeptidase-like regulatory domain-containing protein, partial [Anaerolineales bacterium]|nr:carboxypeptidase-like regulatory domain-containing protein [Anaerolineales bacterium]
EDESIASSTHDSHIAGRRTDQAIMALRSKGSTIHGTAKDQQGNIVSGASVTLTNSARNFTRTQHTNEDGVYVFNTIPPGTYSIEVQALGFKTASVSGLSALVDTPTVVDMQLQVGNVSESVNVTAGAEAPVNSTDATLGNSIEKKRTIELPLNANNVVGLLSLQPGVSRTGYVNGGRADQSNITLNGVDVNADIPGANLLKRIRFQIVLETAAIYEEYRVTIKTLDGRLVPTLKWIEPLEPNQTIIETSVISIDDLPFGDYVLELTGRQADGSFVKVSEYSFKVIKY